MAITMPLRKGGGGSIDKNKANNVGYMTGAYYHTSTSISTSTSTSTSSSTSASTSISTRPQGGGRARVAAAVPWGAGLQVYLETLSLKHT